MDYNTDSGPDSKPPPRRDWGGLAFVVLLFVWTNLTSLAGHWFFWTMQQFFIIDELDWPIWGWPSIAAGHVLLLAVPLVPLAWLWRTPRYRAVFQTWALAAAFILFLVPARFAPPNAALLAAVLQIAGSAFYLAFVAFLIWLRRRRGGPGFVKPQPPYLPALLLVPILSCGWLAWGAFGSWLDTLLNLLAALLFGLAVGLVSGHFLLGPLRRTSSGPGWDISLGGFAVGASLAMMGSGFGFNGLQLLLVLVLPVLGRTLLSLSRFGRERAESSWLALALLVGLVTAAPTLLVDSDELVLVLNMGSRDVFQWSFYAALLTMFVSWGLGIALSLLRNRLPRWRGRAFLVGGTAVTWLAAALIYFLAGQPGFHGERLFVILNDQADLSAALTIDDYTQRRQLVYDTLVEHAEATQADIRAPLDRLGIDYTPYYLVNAIEIEAGPPVRWWLETNPQVDRVLDSPVLRPLPALPRTATGYQTAPATPQWNLTSIGADRVWQEFGVTGEGIVVGQSDSGAQWDHPELKPSYRGNDGQHDYNWFDPWNHTTAPTEIGGHGTHTLGNMVGQTVGVAPGAQWYGCVNLARNLANPALYLDCMQFMLAPFPLGGDPFTDGDPARGAHVINNSWGCPEIEGCDAGALVDGVRALRAAGVFVVSGAGNSGDSCESVADPLSLYDEAFSVGAVDSSGGLALFSSRGPVTADGSGRTKPDIVAPGVDVLSAYPGSTYSAASGTSMAGPHVVGVVALIWSANPDLIGDIDLTEKILIETAQPYDYALHGYPNCAGGGDYPNNAVGYGMLDAYAAVKRALEIGD